MIPNYNDVQRLRAATKRGRKKERDPNGKEGHHKLVK